MQLQGITTMDTEITFGRCEVREVSDETKKLFPNQNLIEVIENGKSFILNTDYVILFLTSLR